MNTRFEIPDLILYNGTIFTADETDSVCSALAVCGNEIVATGESDEILGLAAPWTKLIDLKGRSAMPGINDCHSHLWQAGQTFRGVVLFGIDSFDMLKEKLAERAAATPKGKWITGCSYIESQFKENRSFTKKELDEAAPDHPVVFDRVFGSSVANSRALQLAGITKDTPDPEKGEIVRDPVTGEPNGILHGNAMMLVRNVMDVASGMAGDGAGDPSPETFIELIRTALPVYNSYGITSNTEAGGTRNLARAYHRLYGQGELTLRMALMPSWYGFNFLPNDEMLAHVIDDYDFAAGYGNEWIRYSGLKMAIDYGLTSKTALKSWAYVGDDGPREVPLRLDLDKLDGYIKTAHDAGWDIGIHVMGDIALERAVEAMYKAWKANPREHRHNIIHAYFPTEKALAMMEEMGIMAIVQGSFIYGEGDGYPELLPPDKIESYTPLRTYLDHHIRCGLSTDMPCGALDPFWNMYSAVTRKAMRGTSLGTSECVTVKEAVKMMTYNGAYLTREQDVKGSLEPGKRADIAILDRDLDGIDPEEIRNIKVDMTILAGKVIFTRD